MHIDTRRRIDEARDILVGKVPDPKSQVEQITIALNYKFMDDMDKETIELGGKATFFTGEFEKYSWSNIFDPKLGGFDLINLYSEALTTLNQNSNMPQLFRDLFKNAFLPYRDPETLKSFLKVINGFKYDHSENLGDAYEYLLSVLSSQGDAGQFRTPRHIIDFIVKIIDPKKNETILDPACGTGGFLISSYRHILQQNTINASGDQLTPDDRQSLINNIVGYDISPDMVRLSLMNMYLHLFQNPKIYEYDTLTSEERWQENYDVILANPPFMTPKGGIRPHKRFSIQAKRSEVLFVDYIMEHLNSNGRAGVIVPEGIVFQSQNAYKELRKQLVDGNYLYAVISLPAGVFNPYSGVKTSILLMDRAFAKQKDEILFVKINNDGYDLGAQRREIIGSDIPEVINIIKDYIEGNDVSDNVLVTIASKKDIAEQDYILVGEKYKEAIAVNSKYPLVELGEICNIERGASPRPINEFITDDPNGINWIKIGDGKSSSIYISSTKERISIDGANKSRYVKKGDLILSNSMSYGKPYIMNTDGCVHDGWLIIKDKDTNFNPIYVCYILGSEQINREYKRLATGGVVNNLNSNLVRSCKIPLPPLSIQEEIITEIEGYQTIIDGAKQIVENYKPIIKIDPSWGMVKLAEICEVNSETLLPEDVFGNQSFIYLDISSVENGTGIINYEKFIKGNEAPSRARRKVENGSILLSTVRPNLKAYGFVEFEKPEICVASTGFAVINANKANNKFIYYSLFQDYLQNQMTNSMGKGAYPSINQNDVKNLALLLPIPEIQQRVVDQIDEEMKIIAQNKRLIEIYDQKIKKKISDVWGEQVYVNQLSYKEG